MEKQRNDRIKDIILRNEGLYYDYLRERGFTEESLFTVSKVLKDFAKFVYQKNL